MEAIGAMVEWSSTTRVTGNEHAPMTGAGTRQVWCAERSTAGPLSLRLKLYILERPLTWKESKPPVLGMRPPSHSAKFKNSRKAVLMLPSSVQVRAFVVDLRPSPLFWGCRLPIKMLFSIWQTANQFGWKMVPGAPAEWKCFTMDSGEPFVMTDGACRKQLSHAERWTAGMPLKSNTKPSLAGVRIRFGWMMLSATVVRNPSLTVRTEVLENTIVTTMKMLV